MVLFFAFVLVAIGVAFWTWFVIEVKDNKWKFDAKATLFVFSIAFFVIGIGLFCNESFHGGMGYLADENLLSNGQTYQVCETINEVSTEGKTTLVIKKLQRRDLNSGELSWDSVMVFTFKDMPPTPCFKVIDAEKHKYEAIEINGVSNSTSEE